MVRVKGVKKDKNKLGQNQGDPDWNTILNEAAAFAKMQRQFARWIRQVYRRA